MLGLFARSTKQREEGGPQAPAPAEESEDDDPEAFNYPGMPKPPKPIKLKDPYPGAIGHKNGAGGSWQWDTVGRSCRG